MITYTVVNTGESVGFKVLSVVDVISSRIFRHLQPHLFLHLSRAQYHHNPLNSNARRDLVLAAGKIFNSQQWALPVVSRTVVK